MTLPMSSAATTSRTVDLAGVEVDVDLGDAGRPAERRIRVAAVGRVVEVDARVGLEPLVDPQRRRGPWRSRGTTSAKVPPVAASTCCAQAPAPP